MRERKRERERESVRVIFTTYNIFTTYIHTRYVGQQIEHPEDSVPVFLNYLACSKAGVPNLLKL